MTRPAETAGAGAAVATLLALALGLRDPEIIAALIAIVGLVPAGVTLLVANGGVRGVVRKLWRGT